MTMRTASIPRVAALHTFESMAFDDPCGSPGRRGYLGAPEPRKEIKRLRRACAGPGSFLRRTAKKASRPCTRSTKAFDFLARFRRAEVASAPGTSARVVESHALESMECGNSRN